MTPWTWRRTATRRATRSVAPLALAGDDTDAKHAAIRLYNQLGFDALDIGMLAESWRLDPGQPAFVVPQNLARLRANVAAAKRTT